MSKPKKEDYGRQKGLRLSEKKKVRTTAEGKKTPKAANKTTCEGGGGHTWDEKEKK